MRIHYIFLFTIMLISLKFNSIFSFKKENIKENRVFNIALIDTSNSEKYFYEPFISLARSGGFDFDYKSIINILDSEEKDLSLNKYNGLFLLVAPEFLRGVFSGSLVSVKILNLLQNFALNKNKLIGLIFPSVSRRSRASVFYPIFQKIGIDFKSKPNYIWDTFFRKNLLKALNNFLSFPIESRSFRYHTTLKLPQNIKLPLTKPINSSGIFSLPYLDKIDSRLKPTLPYGIYFLDLNLNNHIFITSNSLVKGFGICENFNLCPMNLNLKKQMCNLISKMFCQLKYLLDTHKNNEKINYLNLKEIGHKKYSKKKQMFPKKNAKVNNKIFKKIAWMEINLFEEKDLSIKDKEQREKQQDFLIESIVRSGSDLSLWINFSPNIYYSPIAVNKNKEIIFWNSVRLFTKKLKKRADVLKVNPPEVLVGFEIARNLYKPNLPKNFAKDLYGNKYIDIPSPLNKDFWKNEVTIPLKEFVNKWRNKKNSNGIKLSGVVIDFEMYLKSSGVFLSTMGFSNKSLNTFLNNEALHNFRDSLNYLVKNKKVASYFKYLKQKAFVAGKNLAKGIKDANIDNIILYMPNLFLNWFYKNFFKGLSISEKPLHLLTFNSEFNMHRDWIESQGLRLCHSSVLMLSKLKNKKDFILVDDILKKHDGIWLNRFSRFSEKKHKDWMAIEQDRLFTKEKLNFFEHLKRKRD